MKGTLIKIAGLGTFIVAGTITARLTGVFPKRKQFATLQKRVES